jgi:hypothetical protein
MKKTPIPYLIIFLFLSTCPIFLKAQNYHSQADNNLPINNEIASAVLDKNALANTDSISLIKSKKNTTKNKKQKPPSGYVPPYFVFILDEAAKTNREGEMYFDNEYGYRYWRYFDGKYYLDAKYASFYLSNKENK